MYNFDFDYDSPAGSTHFVFTATEGDPAPDVEPQLAIIPGRIPDEAPGVIPVMV